MPREIADSDAESDLGSPLRPVASPIPENTTEIPPLSTLEENPFANIEFDQFLSPTQRLSSAADHQDVITSRSTTSTDKFLQDIEHADHRFFDSTANSYGIDGSFDRVSSAAPLNKPKRTFSDIEGDRTRPRLQDDHHQASVKRAKTYGNSRSQRSTSSSLFSDTVEFDHYRNGHPAQAQPQAKSHTTSAELPIQPLVNPNDISDEFASTNQSGNHIRNHNQRGATTFLQSNIQNSFVTKSSMGGYAGINMDFRGAGLGLDTDANPFGSLSQVSLDADFDPSQTEKFANHFRHSQQSVNDTPTENTSDPVAGLRPSYFNEMATSSAESRQEHRSVEHDRDSGRSRSTKATQKPRGRKPKIAPDLTDEITSKADMFQQLQSEDPLDIPQENYQPRLSRSRAGTVESVTSRNSRLSETANISQQKRKRSVTPVVVGDASNKNQSSELNLSDPLMIGAPKEMYVPRPSKSRTKRVADEHNEDELQTNEHEVFNRTQEHASPKSSKKKSTKKSKVKRAKTSAAALLKSAGMYDEDDKDCIIVDEIPAKVKMDPLPEIALVKKESRDEFEVTKGADLATTESSNDDNRIEEPLNGVKISIDIPKNSTSDQSIPSPAPAKPEPKKRGRKPKKKPEVHQDEEIIKKPSVEALSPLNDQPIPTGDLLSARQVLIEKDPNKSTPSPLPTEDSTPPPLSKASSTSPKKPVHSPLKSTRPSTPSGLSWIKPRVGLSRRTSIPSLLRKLDRAKEPPKVHERKEKLSKRQQDEVDRRRLEAEDNGEEYVDRWDARGKDGMLLEWDE